MFEKPTVLVPDNDSVDIWETNVVGNSLKDIVYVEFKDYCKDV